MKFLKLVLPGITMIAVTYGLARFSFGLLLPDMSASLQMSEAVSGTISSLFYFAYCFTIVFSTVMTTREGPKRMILFAGLSAFIGLLFMAGTPNVWVLALGVLLAGGSTGLISPPYGAAISLWLQREQQGRANTWINSGTSLGIVLSGFGAIFLAPDWRLTYLIYAALALAVLIWNYYVIPPSYKRTKIRLEKGSLSVKGVQGANPLIISSLFLGVSTAAFWTFAPSFIEAAGSYSDWQLSTFWIMIGIFGILGGFSGFLVEKLGLPFAYKLGTLLIASASVLLAVDPADWMLAYASAGLFGGSYIFLTGILLVWGIHVFIENASLGIGLPFLLLALGQVFGSMLAGVFIDVWGFAPAFVIFGFVGAAAIFAGPAKNVMPNTSSG
ncbi:putative MFS family arabinose efflux permease [Salsuginibacillus halophilus]|uniref:Putative MFS family arabinose efflux permease n=1 Tax=Salsuginibacillus halophilus TaxID=517424 RepID=A0A2P8H8Q2_9BACI|nr:MFS transporter [Salsuginibacillus halophilus]PSL42571.1 putative MFS family arabinose efflux permease [Salsuginibacillus halophilus]